MRSKTRTADSPVGDYSDWADKIRKELSRFRKADVDIFLRTVRSAVGAAEIYAAYSNETDRLSRLRSMVQSTRKFIASIDTDRPLARPFPSVVDPLSSLSDKEALEQERFYRAIHNARVAAHDLVKELELSLDIAAQEKNKRAKRRRRPPADGLGMAAQLARRYKEIFNERPSSTPGGPFSNVVVLALEEITGKTPRDVSRHVRAALKRL